MGWKKDLSWTTVISVSVVIIIISLIASSYTDLEYHQMGFKKNRITGSVDRTKVYTGGRHWFGPGNTLKAFPLTAHVISFNKAAVFNYEKFEVLISFSLQYFLIRDDLNLLHDKYDVNYAPILKNLLLASIKNAAANFTVDEYRLERVRIEKHLHKAAQKTLGGVCCLPDCTGLHFCLQDCKPRSQCKAQDKGAFAEVRFFQLRAIEFSSYELYTRFLRQTTLLEKQETERYIKEEKVYRKQTEELKQRILVEAAETTQNATIQAVRMRELARIDAVREVEEARTSGLSLVYSSLNMTMDHHKNSIDYVRTLRNQPNTTMYLGFKSMVAKSSP